MQLLHHLASLVQHENLLPSNVVEQPERVKVPRLEVGSGTLCVELRLSKRANSQAAPVVYTGTL